MKNVKKLLALGLQKQQMQKQQMLPQMTKQQAQKAVLFTT